MEVKILFFGQLAAQVAQEQLYLKDMKDTDEVLKQLAESYPFFKKAAYSVAVDQKIIKENTRLNPGAVVALLPPFSGG
ncbi:MoaD/ThiS family protein [Pedobacter sp. MC2016-14]|uniref:MoaD/ThiS family protein n=1 Tax=Pedobacter sp. MC2016-14 TaxID=2897327 RepID=UPI001E2D5BCF|nr:MoaD/ThiS family protein [Pedobacter sp. MC2016-14]MCD0489732.1 MoaD/ThiS family protein [Pedobacter sp. MC2016-14]